MLSGPLRRKEPLVKAIRQLAPLLLAARLLCLGTTAYAETAGSTSGAGSFSMEQVYVNVPELDVYFYAQDPAGNTYTPMAVQAAGVELTLGSRRLDVGSIGQTADPICYLLVLDNSADIPKADFADIVRAVRKLVENMDEKDQLLLYTAAGQTECLLPATSDKTAMYKALAALRQQPGKMDIAAAAAKLYADVQTNFQSLAPRKAMFLCTDAARLTDNLALLGSLVGDTFDNINMAAYLFVSSTQPEAMTTLQQASKGRMVVTAPKDMGQALLDKQALLASALEIRTELPESLYGERLETLTLSIPSLGSAVNSSATVYMGYKMEKPQVTGVRVLNRTTLELQLNQAVVENADKPALYHITTEDIWAWSVPVKQAELSEDGRTVTLTTAPLYAGQYSVCLNKVAARMAPANVSTARQKTAFEISAWTRDRAFYWGRFRGPAAVGLLLLLLLALRVYTLRRREHTAEQAAEAEHLLTQAAAVEALPRRWVTLFWAGRGSIAESRWAGLVESSLMIGSDKEQCDLFLPDKAIRPQHCVLSVQGEALTVQPLADAPVFVNGERIAGEHCLQNNDTLRLGKTTLRLVL